MTMAQISEIHAVFGCEYILSDIAGNKEVKGMFRRRIPLLLTTSRSRQSSLSPTCRLFMFPQQFSMSFPFVMFTIVAISTTTIGTVEIVAQQKMSSLTPLDQTHSDTAPAPNALDSNTNPDQKFHEVTTTTTLQTLFSSEYEEQQHERQRKKEEAELLLQRIDTVEQFCHQKSHHNRHQNSDSEKNPKTFIHNRMITFNSESIRQSLQDNPLIRRVELCVDFLVKLFDSTQSNTHHSDNSGGDYFYSKASSLFSRKRDNGDSDSNKEFARHSLRTALAIESRIRRLTHGRLSVPQTDQILLTLCSQNDTLNVTPTSHLLSSSRTPTCEVHKLIYTGKSDRESENTSERSIHLLLPWHSSSFSRSLTSGRLYIDSTTWNNPQKHPQKSAELSSLYFDCDEHLWLVAYSRLLLEPINESDPDEPYGLWYRVVGFITAEIDVTHADIDQCDVVSANFDHEIEYESFSFDNPRINRINPTLRFVDTHKCSTTTSYCKFLPGKGMRSGAYGCHCKDGFYSSTGVPLNGTLIEAAFNKKIKLESEQLDLQCRRCAEGCTVCVDSSPCLSIYNWPFRIVLLSFAILCIIFCLVLAINIHRYRKVKVIRVASPVFLTITLLGCALMYSETIFIFPVLSTGSCVMIKWTRHFGFCCTYSALLLKTWRVSLTYRVKSAHKIKLTDKQLLHWLFPILLVMAIYLGAWTISDPPKAIDVTDWNGLKFKFCDYNWWDHSLVIGELIFLLWGIKVCYNVRNAESVFNEAKFISCAIYNIALVNTIMIFLRLAALPESGPDLKYLFGFLRIQLSTSLTVALIFGPKFYRVIRGRTDLFDSRRRGLAESFSFNGVGAHEETTDLYQENDELKHEIQKLAAQMEILKICQMQFRNRHLKFSRAPLQHHQQTQTTNSPTVD